MLCVSTAIPQIVCSGPFTHTTTKVSQSSNVPPRYQLGYHSRQVTSHPHLKSHCIAVNRYHVLHHLPHLATIIQRKYHLHYALTQPITNHGVYHSLTFQYNSPHCLSVTDKTHSTHPAYQCTPPCLVYNTQHASTYNTFSPNVLSKFHSIHCSIAHAFLLTSSMRRAPSPAHCAPSI